MSGAMKDYSGATIAAPHTLILFLHANRLLLHANLERQSPAASTGRLKVPFIKEDCSKD
jgi:hypothetical protein